MALPWNIKNLKLRLKDNIVRSYHFLVKLTFKVYFTKVEVFQLNSFSFCFIVNHAGPGEFDIPHSLSLDHEHNHLYIADRENGRIQKYTTDGQFINVIQPEGRGGRLFAVAYGHIGGMPLYIT